MQMHRRPQLVNGDIETLRTLTDRELASWREAVYRAFDALENTLEERSSDALILKEIASVGSYTCGQRVPCLDNDDRYTYAEYYLDGEMDHSVYIYGQCPMNFMPDGPGSSFKIVSVDNELQFITIQWLPDHKVYQDPERRCFDNWSQFCRYWPSPIVAILDK